MKLVKIEWWDHCTVDSTWSTAKDLKKHHSRVLCSTVGYVVGKKKHSIMIAGTIPLSDPINGYYSDANIILRAAIKSITKL